MRIALDAGHGGRDPGAVGHGLEEKAVTLAVARLVAERLVELQHDVKLTRTEDVYVGLTRRCRIANEWGAELFVSVHCNAAVSESAEGIETWHFVGSRGGYALARSIQRSLVMTFPEHRDRGVKESGSFTVLRATAMPAALVELEFISNAMHAPFLASPHQQTKMAAAIAYGIVRMH